MTGDRIKKIRHYVETVLEKGFAIPADQEAIVDIKALCDAWVAGMSIIGCVRCKKNISAGFCLHCLNQIVKDVSGRKVVGDVLEERLRQDRKWGPQNHHMYKWLAILGEEVGEVNKAILENSDVMDVRNELVQVAAVAMAAIESFDRHGLVGKEEKENP